MRCMDKYRRSVQTFVGSRDKTAKVDEIEEDPPEQDNIVQRFHDVVEAFTTVLVFGNASDQKNLSGIKIEGENMEHVRKFTKETNTYHSMLKKV